MKVAIYALKSNKDRAKTKLKAYFRLLVGLIPLYIDIVDCYFTMISTFSWPQSLGGSILT